MSDIEDNPEPVHVNPTLFRKTGEDGVRDSRIHVGPTSGSFKPVSEVGFDPRRHTHERVYRVSLEAQCRDFTESAVAMMGQMITGRLDDGTKITPGLRLKAAIVLIERGHGKIPASDKMPADISTTALENMGAGDLVRVLEEHRPVTIEGNDQKVIPPGSSSIEEKTPV